MACVCLLIGLALTFVCLLMCVQWRLFNSAFGSGGALNNNVDVQIRCFSGCGVSGAMDSCTSYTSDDVDRDGICGFIDSCISDPLTSTSTSTSASTSTSSSTSTSNDMDGGSHCGGMNDPSNDADRDGICDHICDSRKGDALNDAVYLDACLYDEFSFAEACCDVWLVSFSATGCFLCIGVAVGGHRHRMHTRATERAQRRCRRISRWLRFRGGWPNPMRRLHRPSVPVRIAKPVYRITKPVDKGHCTARCCSVDTGRPRLAGGGGTDDDESISMFGSSSDEEPAPGGGSALQRLKLDCAAPAAVSVRSGFSATNNAGVVVGLTQRGQVIRTFGTWESCLEARDLIQADISVNTRFRMRWNGGGRLGHVKTQVGLCVRALRKTRASKPKPAAPFSPGTLRDWAGRGKAQTLGKQRPNTRRGDSDVPCDVKISIYPAQVAAARFAWVVNYVFDDHCHQPEASKPRLSDEHKGMLAYILGASPDASRKHAAREFLAEHGYEWWNTSQRIDNLCAQLRNEQARPPPYQEAAHPVDGTATDVALLLAAVMAEPLTAFVGSFKAVEDDAYKQWKESTSATKSTHPPTMQDWSIWRRHNSPHTYIKAGARAFMDQDADRGAVLLPAGEPRLVPTSLGKTAVNLSRATTHAQAIDTAVRALLPKGHHMIMVGALWQTQKQQARFNRYPEVCPCVDLSMRGCRHTCVSVLCTQQYCPQSKRSVVVVVVVVV